MIVYTNSTIVTDSRKVVLVNEVSNLAKTRGLIELAIRNMVKSLCVTNAHILNGHPNRDNHQHNLHKTDYATISRMQRRKEFDSRNKKRSKGNPKGARKREVRFVIDSL